MVVEMVCLPGLKGAASSKSVARNPIAGSRSTARFEVVGCMEIACDCIQVGMLVTVTLR
jgi:hypothetical protein